MELESLSIADHTQWLTAQVRNPASGKFATNNDAANNF